MSPSLRLAISLALLSAAGLAAAQSTASPDQSLVRLDSVNVFGRPQDVDKAAGSAHYLDGETLQKFNYRDIHRVLRQVPGVYLVEEDGYGLRPNIGIRGSGTDRNSRITVMEDGVLISPAPYAAPAAYYFPTMSRISAVEIRKGSASIQAGPRTTGGALNLISTPIPSRASAELDLSAGSDGTLLAHGWAGAMGERFGGLIEGVRQQSRRLQAHRRRRRRRLLAQRRRRQAALGQRARRGALPAARLQVRAQHPGQQRNLPGADPGRLRPRPQPPLRRLAPGQHPDRAPAVRAAPPGRTQRHRAAEHGRLPHRIRAQLVQAQRRAQPGHRGLHRHQHDPGRPGLVRRAVRLADRQHQPGQRPAPAQQQPQLLRPGRAERARACRWPRAPPPTTSRWACACTATRRTASRTTTATACRPASWC